MKNDNFIEFLGRHVTNKVASGGDMIFVPSEGEYYMNESIGVELARQGDLGQV